MVLDFVAVKKKSIAYIEENLKKINLIAKANKSMELFNDRLRLLLLICNEIEQGYANIRAYIVKNSFFKPREAIGFDYILASYANRCYVACKNMLQVYFANLDTDIMQNIPEERIDILAKYQLSMLYCASRWFSERNMEVWDLERPEAKKKLPRRKPLLEDVMFCFDRLLAVKMGVKFEDGFNIKRLVVCVPPSSGKTYSANVYTAQMIALHQIYYKETGLIRMTNTADNAISYGSQVYKMMTDPKFLKIFPEFERYNNGKQTRLFTYESKEKYLIKDCAPECTDSIFMFGVEASINGKRAMLGSVMDDLSGGVDDMDNDELHRKITDKVMSDVMDRSDDDDSPVVVMGTMYNENDVQNAFIDMWSKNGMIQHPKHKFVQYTPDGTCAICLVDIEDEEGHSIAPLLYTDEKLQTKRDYFRNRGKDYVYNLIYRQHKDSREPKTFAYDTLQTYDEIPEFLLKQPSKCFIDTTRKSGNDYHSQPFLVYNEKDNMWWLIDAIFEQKSLGLDSDPKNEFRDKVCKKIISMNTIACTIESNTSNTTSLVLKDRCKELGYNSCKFKNKYTSKIGKSSSKIVRILNMEETIKNNIRFPSANYKMSPQLFQFMQQLTRWNSKQGQTKQNPDDAPDSLAMFCAEFIYKQHMLGKIEPVIGMTDIFRGIA